MNTYDVLVFGLLALVIWLVIALLNQMDQARRERIKREMMAALFAEMTRATVRREDEDWLMQAQAGGDGCGAYAFIVIVAVLALLWALLTGNLPLF